MNSIILKILFIFLSLNALYADNNNTNFKDDLVKLQVSQEYENKQIEILQNDIKSLEEKFHTSEIVKNTIEEKFKKYDSIIDRQDNRINDISIIISLLGILITIVILIFAFSYGRNFKNIVKNEIESWIETKADKDFEIRVEKYLDEMQKKSEEVLDKIAIEAKKLNKEHKVVIDEFKDIAKPLSDEKETELKNNIREIDKGNKKDFSVNDWVTKVIYKYNNKEYHEALEDLDEALKIADNDKYKAGTLFAKGLTLAKLGEFQKAIDTYDDLINEFKDSKFEPTLEQVAKAYANKGITLGKLRKFQKAIETYDDLIDKFKDSKSEPILNLLQKAKNDRTFIKKSNVK